jgi:hypothetical protein
LKKKSLGKKKSYRHSLRRDEELMMETRLKFIKEKIATISTEANTIVTRENCNLS